METAAFALSFLAILLAISVQTDALNCYECTSSYKDQGSDCDDPINTDKIKPVNCELHYKDTNTAGKNFTMCRKVHQNVEGDKRVIRSCATEGQDKCIDRTGTHKIKLKYCECKGDNCNTASGVDYKASLLLAIVAFFVMHFRT